MGNLWSSGYNKTNNFTQCKINNFNSSENINNERPAKNITLNMSGGARCFKGRTQILENIRLHFTSNEKKMVVIHGAPGFGKTETARRFAINNSDYYKGNLIWIFAETQEKIKECVSNLAINLNLGSSDVSQMYGKFNSSRCLFIFDNVENLTSIREYLPERQLHPTVDILITSQFSQWDASVHKVVLEPLSLEDSLQIFQAKFGDKYRKNKVEIWENVVKYLEGIPLSLQIVSSLIKYEFSQVHLTKFNLEEFINYLKVQFINSKIPESETDSYNNIVFASIRFTLKHLKKEDTCHALDVLCFIAYLDANFIHSVDLLLVPSLEESEMKLERALKKLVKYSLVHVERGTQNFLKIKLHRTIHLVVHKYDSDELNGLMFKTVLKTALSERLWNHYESVFKYVNVFKNKLLEFCHENKYLVNDFLLKLAFHHCTVVLEELLPKIINEFCVTEQIINEMLETAIDSRYKNDMTTIQLLVETYGAKIEISNNKTNVFHWASSWLSIELFDYLLKHSDYENIVNCKDSNGSTILHLLVYDCNENNFENTIKCMEHLISKWNADISIRSYDYTILHTACKSLRVNIRLIRYLIEERNCKYLVNTQDEVGRTPLFVFFCYHRYNFMSTNPELSFEIVSYLLKDCEVDITSTFGRGWNALLCICFFGTFEIIYFVLSEIECRQIINNRYRDGNVAFAMLIQNKFIHELDKIKLINLFVKNEMDFKIRNNENKTLVEIAKKEKLIKLSDELKKYVKVPSRWTSNVLNE